MRSALPKVLHEIGGRPMIGHVLAAAEALSPRRIAVVIGPDMEAVAAAVRPHDTAVQQEPLGTAHAVLAAEALLGEEVAAGADVLVLYGDGPLISPATLQAMLAALDAPAAPSFVWLGVRPPDPTGYGRLILSEGRLQRIVEERDADDEERACGLVWGGLVAGRGRRLFDLARRIGNDNAKSEYYLTALVALGQGEGATSAVVESGFDEVRGVNSRAELAEAEAIFQGRARRRAMDGGATLQAPETVFFSWDTQLAADVTVEPNVVFGPGVTVSAGATIRAFSHIEATEIGTGTAVGPFARLRGGAVLGAEVRIGNFVEVKGSRFGDGAKAAHLSYLGDAAIGAAANIGAGTITCNYDGVAKHRTEIGAGAFIGSNTALVAPVTVGDGAHRRRRLDHHAAGRRARRRHRDDTRFAHGERALGRALSCPAAAAQGRARPAEGLTPMCGIIGILGQGDAAPQLLDGLQRLEYRGYDSAGIATLVNGHIDRRRAEGKLGNLAELLQRQPLDGQVGIGHTRWATHGRPTETNAHPHANERVALVHNGIIENHQALRQELEDKGIVFQTETDTEVVLELITEQLAAQKTPQQAVAATLRRLEGAFALAIMFAGRHDLMIGARRGSPLAVGFGQGEMFLGSDALALAPLTSRICYLEEGDWAELTAKGATIHDEEDRVVERPVVLTAVSGAMIGKGEFRHFMQKEIFEQPGVIGDTLATLVNP